MKAKSKQKRLDQRTAGWRDTIKALTGSRFASGHRAPGSQSGRK